MKLIPLGRFVTVTLEEADDNVGKETLIYQPESAKEKPNHGTVIDAGPDCKGVKTGDRVLFTKYAGKPYEVDGKKYQYLSEAEIIGVFTEEV